MGGGGGTSGVQELPDYIEDQHYVWLTGSVAGTLPSDGGGTPIRMYHGRSIGEILANADDSPLLDVNNPYTGLAYTGTAGLYTSPENDLAAVQEKWEETETAVAALSATTDYATLLAQAVAQADVAGTLQDIVMSTLVSAGGGDADAEIALAKAVKDSGISEATNWAAFVDAVVAKLDTAGVLTTVDFSAIEPAAITDASGVIAAALSAASTGISESTLWDGFVDSVAAKLQECGVLDDIDLPTLFNMSMAEATRSVEESVRAATEIINDTLLDPIVTGYEQRISFARNKALRIFSGQMADANAVHSSSFLIGLALIHTQYLEDVDKFANDLTLRAYDSAVQIHASQLTNFYNTALQGASENVRARTTIFLDSMRTLTQIVGYRVSFEQALTQLYAASYGQSMEGQISTSTTNKTGRDRLLAEGAQQLASLLNVRADYEKSLIQLHAQVFLDVLGRHLQTAVSNKGARDTLVRDGSELLSRHFFTKHQLDMDITKLLGEQKRIAIVARAEHESSSNDLRAQKEMWPFLVYEHAMNALGAPTGMAGIVGTAPSRMSSTLGGALQGAGAGASTGAMIGAAGGPIGAGGGAAIGAVLGGLAGFLSR